VEDQAGSIKNMGEWLAGQKLADASGLQKIENEAREEMKAAVEFAIAAPYPGVEEVDQDVYALNSDPGI